MTYDDAHVCLRLPTYAYVCLIQAYVHPTLTLNMLTHTYDDAHVCLRLLTYAYVCLIQAYDYCFTIALLAADMLY